MLTAPAIDRITVTLTSAHVGRSRSVDRAATRFRTLLVETYGPRARTAAEVILQAATLPDALAQMASFCRTKPTAHKGA